MIEIIKTYPSVTWLYNEIVPALLLVIPVIIGVALIKGVRLWLNHMCRER